MNHYSISQEISILFTHKRKNRGRTPGQSVGVRIFMGVLFFFMGINFLSAGFLSQTLIKELFPNQDTMKVCNGLLFYWFGLEFLTRNMVQSIPVMDIVPYLHLPVRKSSLIRFLQIKGFTHLGNYIAFLLFIPTAMVTIAKASSVFTAIYWLFLLLIFTWLIMALVQHMKRREMITPSSSLVLTILIVGMGVAEYFGWLSGFSLMTVSTYVFNALLHYPFLGVLPLALLAFVLWRNFLFMTKHAYVDEVIQKRQEKIEMQGFFLGKRLGRIGNLMDLDIKLVWRNKRTRSLVYSMGLFLFYGLFIYVSPQFKDNLFFLYFVGVFISGFPMINYGQMPFDSSYFEGMMAKITLSDYIKARYTLFISLSVITYILTLPYAFFGIKIFWINMGCFLYNVGVNSIILLHIAAYSRKKVDISQGSAMNLQGTTPTQIIGSLVLIVIPGIIAAISGSVWPIAALGIAGILSYKLQLKWVLLNFQKQKHAIIEGFRKN